MYTIISACILEETDRDVFLKIAGLLFTDFPAEGQTKEVVIPNKQRGQALLFDRNKYSH
jgi:hypothetical protein